MDYCDICGTPYPKNEVIVSAPKMSNAVRKGFDPWKEELMLAAMAMAGQVQYDQSQIREWKQSAINGKLSTNDWLVCGFCMEKLSPYLTDANEDQPLKKWWQIWK